MDSLSEEIWDLVIAGTSLQQSLLALSLSRSDKKILHVDRHDYYGGEDAGLSLKDAENWVQRLQDGARSAVFADPLIQQADRSIDDNTPKLASSRAYTVSLRPQIVYARSAFLPTLVSSQIHSQLEFLAVGSWWVLRENELHKIPSTREDVFNDDMLSMRDKRSLMKFLRFVLQEDSDTSAEAPEPQSDLTLQQTLDKYKIPASLQAPILALALSPQSARETKSDEAVLRIRRHLQSVGYFGPGFGAVIAKYGGNAEISQVACRAQAVGGGVYLLGHGIKAVVIPDMLESATDESKLTHITLSDGTSIRAKQVVGGIDDVPRNEPIASTSENYASLVTLQSISIVSDGLKSLFPPTSESGPVPAAAIVLVERSTASDGPPIYLQIHTEDTGECPSGQCVVYGSTMQQPDTPPKVLHDAVSQLLNSIISADNVAPKILWHMTYNYHGPSHAESDLSQANIETFPSRPFEIGVEDDVLEPVRKVWQSIIPESPPEAFLRFEERGQEFEDS